MVDIGHQDFDASQKAFGLANNVFSMVEAPLLKS